MRTPVAVALLAACAAGCGTDTPADAPPPPVPPPIGLAFDPASAGAVTGRVVWAGALPDAPRFPHFAPAPEGFEHPSADNPNRPLIDPESRAIAGVVVSLRGVNPASARSWDLDPVRVEIGNGLITVIQGERRGRVGFVRAGDPVMVASTDPKHQVLRGRGAAHFGLTLPEPGRPVARALPEAGRIELSCGAGAYWPRADLFVADHPYFTLTDPAGRFTLDRVPAGRYEVAAWLPGWGRHRQDRNPDSPVYSRMTYTKPVERVAGVTINPGLTSEAGFAFP